MKIMKKNKLLEKHARLIKIKKHNLQQIKNKDAVDYHIAKEERKRKDRFVIRAVLCGLGAFCSAYVAMYYLLVSSETFLIRCAVHSIFVFAFLCFFLQPLEEYRVLSLSLSKSATTAKKA